MWVPDDVVRERSPDNHIAFVYGAVALGQASPGSVDELVTVRSLVNTSFGSRFGASLDAEIDGVLSRLEGSTGLRLVGPCMKKRRGDGEEHAQGNVDPEVSVVAHCQLDDLGTQEREAIDNRSCWPVRDAPGDDRCDDEQQAGRTNGTSDDLVSVQLGVVATAQEQSDEHRLCEQQHHINRDHRSEEQRS